MVFANCYGGCGVGVKILVVDVRKVCTHVYMYVVCLVWGWCVDGYDKPGWWILL